MSESGDKARLIAALISARSAIESVLLQIADDVEPGREPQSQAATTSNDQYPVSSGACGHEEKLRKQIKSMGSTEHWLCDPMKGGCGYEYRR